MPVAYGLIEPVDLPVPDLPLALEGLRIAHLSDLHIIRRTDRIERLGNQLTTLRIDLVLFTGDYMNEPGGEQIAGEVMRRLCARLRPGIGSFGVFGNHDSAALRESFAQLPIHWLHNQRHLLPDRPIELMGLDMLRHETPDATALLLERGVSPEGPATDRPAQDAAPLGLLLAHDPGCIMIAADMGANIMFAGHTHGGQIRLPGGRPLVNQCDMPLRLTAGVLRHRDTLGVVSRGLGETGFPRRRLFCKPHVPLYTLRRRTTPGRRSERIDLLRKW